ncbi:oligopeptide/dipeptide ABC transporter ATP-binding protein [Mesorhizobium sp. M0435]|uniref:oligopeptide/dipeptide ABC transporter ATP-binding protein n=1 Tax=unclassified Mesorhizobium TaxID=325217 RepID=UPI003336D5DF
MFGRDCDVSRPHRRSWRGTAAVSRTRPSVQPGLLSAVPSPDPRIEADRRRIILAGDPPSPSNPPPGCRFNTRCPVAMNICRLDEPQLRPVPHGGVAACHLAESDHRR